MNHLPLQLINLKGAYYGVDPHLIMAIIQKESGGNTWATRYEPGSEKWVTDDYQIICHGLRITPQTERQAQMHSWGLGQVMGFTARKIGFKGHLASLCDREIGINYTCLILNDIKKRYKDLEEIISSYNQGSPKREKPTKPNEKGELLNQSNYVDPVLAFIEQLRSNQI